MLSAERVQVEEPRHDVRALDDDARALERRALDQRVDPDGDGGGLLAEPERSARRPSGRRLAERRVGLERRRVQRGHQLGARTSSA